MYRGKRDLLHSALAAAGFRCRPPEGAYYILADFTGLGPAAAAGAPLDDTAFSVWLSREVGVTPVPGSSFYREGGGRSLVRFVFCKTEEILAEAARRLRGLRGTVAPPEPRAAEPAVESGLQR
jgi:aminotransferase